MNRELAFSNLDFIGENKSSSLSAWRRATREMIKVFKDKLRGYASHDTSLNYTDSPQLSFIYSLFAILCILISKEFDAALVAIVEDNPAPLTSLLPKETPLDAVLREAYSITEFARMNWKHAAHNKGLNPVHTLTNYEMKLCLQERGLLHHTLPAWKRSIHFKTVQRVTWRNLLLSVDPFTPPELAGEMVESMLREYQADYVKGIGESWKPELMAGAITEDFPARDSENEKLRFDFRRAFAGNKKTRGEGTTFEIWLRRLEVYDLDSRGLSSKRIGERIKCFKDDPSAAVKISQDKAQARAMIAAALSGLPVSAVANIRAARS